VSDEIVISPNQNPAARSNSVEERAEELDRFLAVWGGALHEFRNHLTVLLAAATEIRSAIPPAMASDVAEAVADTDRNVQSLSSLIAQLDAAVKGGEPLISDLDEIIEQALRLAAPALGRRTSVAVSKGRKTGVKNRGAALECLLSTLLVHLARAEGRPGDRTRNTKLEIHVEVGRGSLLIEIQSDGEPPPPGSWRLLLATALAEKVDATISPHPESAGYLIQFR
jgi:hypothetical protein